MKKIILLAFLFLSFHQAQASCCALGRVTVQPTGAQITQNSIFMISFQEGYYPFTQDLIDANIYLASETGRRVKLKMIDMVIGPVTGVTLVLRPTRKLKMGKTVSIEIEGLPDEGRGFKVKIEQRKWTVSLKKDRHAPIFVGEPIATFKSPVTSEGYITINSAGSVVIKGKIDYADNDKSKQNQVLLELTVQDGSGVRFFAIVSNGEFSIQSSICGGNFDVEHQKDYTFKVRLMDFSGNKSKEYKLLGVSTKF